MEFQGSNSRVLAGSRRSESVFEKVSAQSAGMFM
jgi:hypothetical protein